MTAEDGRATVHRYGDAHPDQRAELTLPAGGTAPRGVVVVIHGGFWRARYDLSLGRPLASRLAAAGWAAWNLEYRRVGDGGGGTATCDDVAAGIDALAATGLDLSRVVTLGHSAGGHLAVWAAGRTRHDRWAGGVRVTGAIAQAGVLDLRAAHRDRLGDGAVEAFLGHPPAAGDDALDPARAVPLDVPVRCVHGPADDVVPLDQSLRYARAARAAGADVQVVEVPGDHMALVDVAAPAWARTMEVLAGLAGDGPGPAGVGASAL